jgi:hypothetical protein
MSLLGDRKRECPGFSSFLEPLFFSFQKEKNKVTKNFEIKEKLKLKRNLVFKINSDLPEGIRKDIDSC